MQAATFRAGQIGDGRLATASRLPLQRVLAIDAFRGLTMLVMIFVNTLAGVRGMPAWLDHMPADVDGMTFPDVVFPAFLFIVGMSVPFALGQRMAAGDSFWQLQRRILARAAALLVLGVFMVNAEEGYNEQAMHMSIHAWSLLFYGAAILVWHVRVVPSRRLDLALRAVGVVGLIVLGIVFRGAPDGSAHLAPQWWGILGLIGWAYLFSSVFYQLARGRVAALLAVLAACVAYWCLAHVVDTNASPALALLFSQTDNAAHTSIALSGTICALIFFDRSRDAGIARRYGEALALMLVLALAAFLLRPDFKISKIYATPSWCLYSATICIALFGAMYWLVDLKGRQRWTRFFQPAAANPLLAYIIPYIVYAWMQYAHWSLPALFDSGWPGLLWSVAYAFAVLAFVRVLNRLHLRLHI